MSFEKIVTAWPKRHEGCPAEISEEQWKTLPDRKEFRLGSVLLEQALCPGGCGSHLAIVLEDNGDEEGEDAHR